MTGYEHIMLSTIYGCTIGWIIGSLIFVVKELIISFKEDRKAKREKEEAEKDNDNL